MKNGEFLSISSSVLTAIEKEYDATQIKRDEFSRKFALEGKIEASEVRKISFLAFLTLPYYTKLYNTVLYCTILYYTILYYTIL